MKNCKFENVHNLLVITDNLFRDTKSEVFSSLLERKRKRVMILRDLRPMIREIRTHFRIFHFRVSFKFHGKEEECDRIGREGQACIDTDLISFIRQLVKRATIPTPGKNYGSVSKLRRNVALQLLRCGLLLRLVVAVSWVRRLLGRGLDRRWRGVSIRTERTCSFVS